MMPRATIYVARYAGDMSTTGDPHPDHDPRLEIPKVLQEPVQHPALNRPKPKADGLGLGDLSKALAMGVDFLATIAAGGAIGYGIDYWRGWTPYSLLVGVLIGFAYATVRIIQRSNAEDKAASERKRLGK